MSIERTDAVIARYMDGDRTVIAEHAVYTDMGSGERFEGRDAIDAMFGSFYGKAFDVKPEDTRRVVGDGYAMFEASLVGRHVGAYAGVPATGATVRIPLCVTYRIEDDEIVEARIYLAREAFLRQVTGGTPAPPAA